MKKYLIVFISLFALFSITGCDDEPSNNDDNNECTENCESTNNDTSSPVITVNENLPTSFELLGDCSFVEPIVYTDYFTVTDKEDGAMTITEDDISWGWFGDVDQCDSGSYTATLKVTDSDGNTTTERLTFRVAAESRYNYITVTDSASYSLGKYSSTSAESVSIGCTTDSELSSITYTHNDSFDIAVECSNTITLTEEGTYTVKITTSDSVSKDFIFYIDRTAPSSDLLLVNGITGDNLSSEYVFTNEPVSITCVDTTEVYNYAVAVRRGGSFSSMSTSGDNCSKIAEFHRAGTYTITLKDTAGNTTDVIFTVVDDVPPSEEVIKNTVTLIDENGNSLSAGDNANEITISILDNNKSWWYEYLQDEVREVEYCDITKCADYAFIPDLDPGDSVTLTTAGEYRIRIFDISSNYVELFITITE